MALTDQEKNDIKKELLNAIKAESTDATELERATSLDALTGLPAMQGEKMVLAPLNMLAKPATEAAEAAKVAAQESKGAAKQAVSNLEHLRKRIHPTASFASLESTFATLGANYSTLWALANTLKKFLYTIVDLGVVSNQAAAENAAAERTVTENSNVRIIMWRTGDNGRGDGGQIIQSRWGNYYVIQVMMFVGQEHSCRYRLITTGGNYSVGEWNDLIIPSLVYYDPGTHRVMYNGFLPGDDNKKTLFEIPVADDEELGLIRIGGSFYMGENDELNIRTGKGITFDEFGNIQAKVNTAHGLAFDEDGKLKIKEGWRPVPQGKRSATPEDNCFVYATDDPESKSSVLNAPDTLLKQKDGHLMFQKGMWNPNGEAIFYTRNQVPVATESCDGVMSADDKRNLNNLLNPYNGSGLANLGDGICISTGAGITINADNELVLNLADNGGLVINNDAQLTIDVPKLKEMLGLN